MKEGNRIMNLGRAAAIFAWLMVGLIVYSTLSPIALRPHLGTGVHIERLGAYGLLGLLLATAYPRRIWLVLAVLLAGAAGLEVLQTLSPDRHARLGDLAVKMAGSACGVAAARFGARHLSRLRPVRTG